MRDAIEGLDPYIPGRSAASLEDAFDGAAVVKIGSNESPYGPFPGVARALTDLVGSVNRYPERGHLLAESIARFWDISSDRIQLGNGADPIIGWLCQAFLDPGDEAVMPAPSFVSYALDTRKTGGTAIQIPLLAGRHDIQRMSESVTDRTKLMFVCNPNNPTGDIVDHDSLTWLLNSVPERVLVVIDEAYAEYVDDPRYPTAVADLANRWPNVAVLRTFSKLYGLAGLRVGYCVAQDDVVRALGRVRHYFDVSDLAHLAAATSLGDQQEVARRRAENLRVRATFEGVLDECGATRMASHTNFVTLEVDDCENIAATLINRGIITRPVGRFKNADLLRITMGTSEQMDQVADELASILRQAQRGAAALAYP